MSLSLEALNGLKRRLTIQIPTTQVEVVYQARLKKAAKNAKLAGFRPGKVPMNVLEKRYGQEILGEAANELLQSQFQEAVKEKHLHIAGNPHIETSQVAKGKPVEFVIHFEVFPEITLKSLKGQHIHRYHIEVKEPDVDQMLHSLQKQHAEWEEVDRAAKIGDRVVLDFEGSINGEPFDRGSAKDFQLELGSKRMIEGFEEGIVGIKPGETKDIKVTFPKDYPGEELAGKKAVFKITVHKVKEPKLPLVDDEFAKKLGIQEGGLNKLRSEIQTTMQTESKQIVKRRLKKDILDKLVEVNPVEIPESLVDAEVDHLQQMTRQQMAAQTQRPEEAKKIELPREPYVDQAKKRVALGLLLAEVIKEHEIKVDADQVRARVEEIAKAYHKPEEVISWYYNNKRMLSEIESVVLEDQAIEKLLAQTDIHEKDISYEEATQYAQQTKE